jgi:hypothetical protein
MRTLHQWCATVKYKRHNPREPVMPYAWSSDLETGNTTIDNQHKQLIGALNELIDVHQSGKGRQEVESALAHL